MKKNLTALTGIRFLAAFYVFLYHVDMRIPFSFLHPRLGAIIKQGATGVNVFFILSGFILTYAHYRKPIVYGEFILKRLFRIYPAYLAGFALCLLVFVPGGKVFTLDLAMLESYFPLHSHEWYGGGAWSISTEFFFYFLFPLLLPFFVNRSLRSLLYWLIGLTVLAALPGTLQNVYHFNVQLSYSFPPARLAEFVAGIAGGLLVFKYGLRVKAWAAIAGMALLCVYFAGAGYRFGGWTVHNFLLVPITLAVLAACVDPGRGLRWIGSRWMEYLGHVSYGFYIVQIPIMLALEEGIAKGLVNRENLALVPVILGLNLLLSIALYEAVEKPVHRYFHKTKRAAQEGTPIPTDKENTWQPIANS